MGPLILHVLSSVVVSLSWEYSQSHFVIEILVLKIYIYIYLIYITYIIYAFMSKRFFSECYIKEIFSVHEQFARLTLGQNIIVSHVLIPIHKLAPPITQLLLTRKGEG